MDGQVMYTHGKDEVRFLILVKNPERERQLWGPRRRWEDNIKMYLKNCEFVYRI
jgi:hypothetical protein